MKITITAVSRKQRTSARTGKPFTSLGLKTQEHGEKWLSGFGNVDNADWKAGDTVEVEIEEKNGYLNFSTPKKDNTPQTDNRLINLIEFKVLPLLEEIRKDQITIDGRIALLLQRSGYTEVDVTPIPDFG